MSSQKRLLPPPPQKPRPDMSLAIVNIVLLLLFFFLATGSLVSAPSFDIQLSETGELPIDQLPKPILVIQPDGTYDLNGTSLSLDELEQDLRNDSVLHVLIDRNAPAHELLTLLARPVFETLDIRLVTLHASGDV